MFESIPQRPLGSPIGEGLGGIAATLMKAREQERQRQQFQAKLLLDRQNIEADNRRADAEMGLQYASFNRTTANQKGEEHRKAVEDFQHLWEMAGKDPKRALAVAKAMGYKIDATDFRQPKAIPVSPDAKPLGPPPEPRAAAQDAAPGAAPGQEDITLLPLHDAPETPQLAPDQRDPMLDIHMGEGTNGIDAQGAPVPPEVVSTGTADLEARFADNKLPAADTVAAVLAGARKPKQVIRIPDISIDARDTPPAAAADFPPIARAEGPTPGPGYAYVDQIDDGTAGLTDPEGAAFNAPVGQLPPGVTEQQWIRDPRAARQSSPPFDPASPESRARFDHVVMGIASYEKERVDQLRRMVATGRATNAQFEEAARAYRDVMEGRRPPGQGSVNPADENGPIIAAPGRPEQVTRAQYDAEGAGGPPQAPVGADVRRVDPASQGEALGAAASPTVADKLRAAAFRISGGPANLPELEIDPEASRVANEEALAREVRLRQAAPEVRAAAAAELAAARQADEAKYRLTVDDRLDLERRRAADAMARTNAAGGYRVAAARVATGTPAPGSEEELPAFGSKSGNQRLDAEGKLDNVVQKVLTNTGYKAEAVQNRKFNQLSTIIAGAKDNAALAQAGAGAWVKQAQGGVGVLSDKDMTVFWDRIGGIPDRIDNWINSALSGKMGPARQKIVADAVRQLATNAQQQLQGIGEQIRTRLSGVDYADPEVIDRYVDTYVPGLAPPRRPTAPLHRGMPNAAPNADPLRAKAQRALDDPNAPPNVKAAARKLLGQ